MITCEQTIFFCCRESKERLIAGYMSNNLGNVYTTPDNNFKTAFSLLKRIKYLPSTVLSRRNWKTQQSPVILDLCLRRTGAGKSHDYRDVIYFWKVPFSNYFLFTRKCKAGVFKFLPFEESFQKAPFSGRTSVDCRPNRRNKDWFSNFFAAVWTRP